MGEFFYNSDFILLPAVRTAVFHFLIPSMHPYQITTSSKYPTSAYYSTELTNSVNSGAFDFNLYTTAATYGATYFVTASSGPVPVGE